MLISRLLCLLLVPLFTAGGVGVANEVMVLCIADSHIAIEAADDSGACSETADDATAASDSSLGVTTDCFDIGLATSEGRIAPEQRGAEIPQLLPFTLAGFLIPSVPYRVDVSMTARVDDSPPHLLPLDSFLLLI